MKQTKPLPQELSAGIKNNKNKVIIYMNHIITINYVFKSRI